MNMYMSISIYSLYTSMGCLIGTGSILQTSQYNVGKEAIWRDFQWGIREERHSEEDSPLGARNPRGDEEKKGERIEQGDGLSEYVGFDVQLWD